jgi:predicted adenylyl cyclase CyaB
MERNVEIKARIESVAAFLPRVAALATSGPTEIIQDDTFFTCPNGRLKLREFGNGTGELIFYRRPDEAGPKESRYLISPTACPDALRELLTVSHGQIGRVEKRRTLFMVGRTRVHLDRVSGLGDFMELEVVLGEDESAESASAEARSLMETLDVRACDLIAGAYLDLLLDAGAGVPGGSALECECKSST